jgi:hypothetical protein
MSILSRLVTMALVPCGSRLEFYYTAAVRVDKALKIVGTSNEGFSPRRDSAQTRSY